MSPCLSPQGRQDVNGNTASENHNPSSQNSERRTLSRRNSNNRPEIPERDSSLSRGDWIGGLCAGSHLIQLLLYFLGFLFLLIVDIVLRPVVLVSSSLAFVVVLLVTDSVWFGCIGVLVGFQSRHCIGNA